MSKFGFIIWISVPIPKFIKLYFFFINVNFLDVIEAYKGATKEKEALEKSLKALNLSEANITQELAKDTRQNDLEGEATKSINEVNI